MCAKTSSVTVLPLTAPDTVNVPVVTPSEHASLMVVIAWPPLARARDVRGLPMVPNPISASPPTAAATPVSRITALRVTREAAAYANPMVASATRATRSRRAGPFISRRPPNASESLPIAQTRATAQGHRLAQARRTLQPHRYPTTTVPLRRSSRRAYHSRGVVRLR